MELKTVEGKKEGWKGGDTGSCTHK